MSKQLAVQYINATYRQHLTVRMLDSAREYFTIHFSLQDTFLLPQRENGNNFRQQEVSGKIVLMDGSLRNEYVPGKYDTIHTLRLIMKRSYAEELARELFSQETVEEIFSNRYHNIFLQLYMPDKCTGLLQGLGRMSMEDKAFGLSLTGVAYSLIATLKDVVAQRQRSVVPRLLKNDIEAIHLTQQFLLEAVENDFPGIERLAAMAHMSPTKYKLLYTRIYGMPPKKYFIQKKMELAREMLATGNYRVSEIVYELGYSNQGFFTQQFRKIFGVLPKQLVGRTI